MNMISILLPVLESLHSRISYLENLVRKVAERVHIPEDELEPPPGSQFWWVWAENLADEDIQAGRVQVFTSAQELDDYFARI